MLNGEWSYHARAVDASVSVDFSQNLQQFEMRHSVLEAHTLGVLELT